MCTQEVEDDGEEEEVEGNVFGQREQRRIRLDFPTRTTDDEKAEGEEEFEELWSF